MNTRALIIIGASLLIVAALAGGLWAYDFVLGDTQAAGGPIVAVPLAIDPTSPSTQAVALEAAAVAAPASGLTTFEIVPEQSEVRFSIYEELNRQPKTVVGTTDQVAGQVALDLSDLSKTQVGVIQVNARTFATDSDRRDRAIRNFILFTDRYEFITFTPTEIAGLSGAAQPGQPVTFQVAGTLTIRDISLPAVFEVTVEGESSASLAGTATAVVRRSDYGLSIPSVPNVANVGEEVTIEIEFVAAQTS
jgi:polyisoprenoid-binding protein YceI